MSEQRGSPVPTPRRQSMRQHWWRAACGAIGIVLLLMLVLNPELFAAFGFLVDAALVDAFLVLLGFQLQLFGAGLWLRVVALCTQTARRISVPSRRIVR